MRTLMRGRALVFIVTIGFWGQGSAAQAQDRQPGGDRGNTATPRELQDIVVVNEVGRTTILFVKPEGTHVKKGDLVCELDASDLKDELDNQRIGTEGAKAAYRNARLSREAAEIAVKEYTEGIYKQEIGAARSAIDTARGEVKRAEALRDDTQAQVKKNALPRERLDVDELAVKKARLSLEKAESQRTTLEKLTHPRKLKQLQLEVEKAAANEAARIVAYDREQTRLDELRKKVDRCKILAPVDGRVSYRRPDGNGPRFRLERGAAVRDGEFLVRIIPEAAPTKRENR